MNSTKNFSYFLGIYSEYLIIIFLFKKGFILKKWRYKNKLGEIDIIAINKKSQTIIFAEVKFRSNKNYLNECLNQKQVNRIYKSAEVFIYENLEYKDYLMKLYLYLINDDIQEIPMF
jgi:putative endonuclease